MSLQEEYNSALRINSIVDVIIKILSDTKNDLEIREYGSDYEDIIGTLEDISESNSEFINDIDNQGDVNTIEKIMYEESKFDEQREEKA